MCPQTPADQHNTPVLSHIETYAAVPLHHRLSSLSHLCPSTCGSVLPQATAPFLLQQSQSLSSLRQAVPPTLQHKLQVLFHKHVPDMPFPFLPLPDWQLFPLGAAMPGQAAAPNPSIEQTAFLLLKCCFPPTPSWWLFHKWMSRDWAFKWAFKCLGGSW